MQKRDVQTPCHNPQSWSRTGAPRRKARGGIGVTECHSGDAIKNKEVASSNFDSCGHTRAHLGDVDMEAGKERTNSAEPRTLPCESGTEVDTGLETLSLVFLVKY